MIYLLAVLLLAGASVNGQTITQTFGTGANAFSIKFVEIGNPGNDADNTGLGAVDYYYNLGKYEISRDQINKANSVGALGITLFDLVAPSMQSGYSGNGENRPGTGISWYEAAKFVNYLNTSQGKQPAYRFDESGNFQLWNSGAYSGNNRYRHKDALFVLPSVDEWYKGAYYDPNRNGIDSGGFWKYPTQSDALPTSVYEGTSSGTAVYYHTGSVYFGRSAGPADIDNAGGLSAYGTMAQAGNAHEWMESAYFGTNDIENEPRWLRGGSWSGRVTFEIEAAPRVFENNPFAESKTYGFRVAMVPEPSSLSLMLAGGAVLMAGRRRKV